VAASINKLPSFVQARSPRGLRLAMFKNNAKDRKQYHYFDIQYIQQPSGRRVWFAWFYKDASPAEALTDLRSTNGST